MNETPGQGVYLRIGNPPQGKKVRKFPKTTAIVIASLVLAGASVAAILINGRPQQAAAAASPTPSLARLGKQETCLILVPALIDAAKQITAIVQTPDGTTVEWERVRTLIRDMKMMRDSGAPELSPDVAQQVPALQHILDLYMGLDASSILNLDAFRSSGLRLAAQCSAYASN